MATRPSKAWKQPTMIIMMAANKINPTAPPLDSSPLRAADDEYASSVISRSLLCCPAGHLRPAAADDRLHPPTRTRQGHHPLWIRSAAAVSSGYPIASRSAIPTPPAGRRRARGIPAEVVPGFVELEVAVPA